MLNDDQKARLRDRGVLHLPGFLLEAAFRPVRERVERVMLDEGHFDGTDWIVPAERPKWPNGGFAGKRIKKAKELRLLDTEDLRATIQDLLDGEDLFTFMDRPQPLFTLNNADEWFLPSTIWHVDLPRFAGCDEPVAEGGVAPTVDSVIEVVADESTDPEPDILGAGADREQEGRQEPETGPESGPERSVPRAQAGTPVFPCGDPATPVDGTAGPEPCPPLGGGGGAIASGSPGRTRTCDQSVNSRSLYQLSYRGTDRKSTRLNSSHSSVSRMPSSA